MNKYFLSLISILILFQSFKVADEIFHKPKAEKKSYVIIESENEEVLDEVETVVKKKEVNFDQLFQNASIDSGKKISKQCTACHSVDSSLKIKVGPPLWGILGRKSVSISDFKYSKALMDFKKNWSQEELFYF